MSNTMWKYLKAGGSGKPPGKKEKTILMIRLGITLVTKRENANSLTNGKMEVFFISVMRT